MSAGGKLNAAQTKHGSKDDSSEESAFLSRPAAFAAPSPFFYTHITWMCDGGSIHTVEREEREETERALYQGTGGYTVGGKGREGEGGQRLFERFLPPFSLYLNRGCSFERAIVWGGGMEKPKPCSQKSPFLPPLDPDRTFSHGNSSKEEGGGGGSQADHREEEGGGTIMQKRGSRGGGKETTHEYITEKKEERSGWHENGKIYMLGWRRRRRRDG